LVSVFQNHSSTAESLAHRTGAFGVEENVELAQAVEALRNDPLLSPVLNRVKRIFDTAVAHLC
jgi:hypothetical protein